MDDDGIIIDDEHWRRKWKVNKKWIWINEKKNWRTKHDLNVSCWCAVHGPIMNLRSHVSYYHNRNYNKLSKSDSSVVSGHKLANTLVTL